MKYSSATHVIRNHLITKSRSRLHCIFTIGERKKKSFMCWMAAGDLGSVVAPSGKMMMQDSLGIERCDSSRAFLVLMIYCNIVFSACWNLCVFRAVIYFLLKEKDYKRFENDISIVVFYYTFRWSIFFFWNYDKIEITSFAGGEILLLNSYSYHSFLF